MSKILKEIIAPSSSKNKKKKNDKTLHASSDPIAETQSGNEHGPSKNINDDVHDDAQPSNDNDVEIEPAVDLDNPQPKNQRYDKKDFCC